MKINSKDQRLAFAKSIDSEKRQVSALVSTYEWDRTFERFSKGAWRLDNFKKNPVVMWAHDYHRPPIGKAIEISENDSGLNATVQFADDEFSDGIWQLMKGGFLSAFSVGFNPLNFQMEPVDGTKKGVVYTDAELLEFSVVSIPANPGAVIGRELAQIAQKHIGAESILVVKNGDKEEFIVSPGPEKPEEPKPPEPEPSPAPKDLASSLKYIVDLAKAQRHGKMEKQDLSLLANAISTFQEIINEHTEGVPAEVIVKLHGVVDSLAEAVKDLYPDAVTTVQRVMLQIDKALTRGRAA